MSTGNISTSTYLANTQLTTETSSSSGESSLGNIGMSFVDLGARNKSVDVLFLTDGTGDSARASGYVVGGQVMDLPPSLQNKTMAEIKTALVSTSEQFSGLPSELKGTSSSYGQAPFPKAATSGSTSSDFTLETNNMGKITSIGIRDSAGGAVSNLALSPPLTLAEFSHMVRSESAPAEMRALVGKSFTMIETMANTPSPTPQALTGADSSLTPPKIAMVANPYLTPSTAAQLTSILMDVAALKAKVADKESQAILNTMQFMLEEAKNRIALNAEKADAEKLAAMGKIVGAAMSIMGAVLSIGGAAANQRAYEADKKGPKQAEVTGTDSGVAPPDAAAAKKTDRTQQRDSDLRAGEQRAAETTNQKRKEEDGVGASAAGTVHNDQESDQGRLTSTSGAGEFSIGSVPAQPKPAAPKPLADDAGAAPARGPEQFTLSSGHAPADTVAAPPTPKGPTGGAKPDPAPLAADQGHIPPTGSDTGAVSAAKPPVADASRKAEATPATSGEASGQAGNAGHVDAAGKKPDADKSENSKFDPDMAKARFETRNQMLHSSSRMFESSGQIFEQGIGMAATDLRSRAEQNEIVSQTYKELTQMNQQGLNTDLQTVNSEFLEVLKTAQELMRKETDQLAQLFQMRM